jgi:hypothetical protein
MKKINKKKEFLFFSCLINDTFGKPNWLTKVKYLLSFSKKKNNVPVENI